MKTSYARVAPKIRIRCRSTSYEKGVRENLSKSFTHIMRRPELKAALSLTFPGNSIQIKTDVGLLPSPEVGKEKMKKDVLKTEDGLYDFKSFQLYAKIHRSYLVGPLHSPTAMNCSMHEINMH